MSSKTNFPQNYYLRKKAVQRSHLFVPSHKNVKLESLGSILVLPESEFDASITVFHLDVACGSAE